MDTNNAYRVLGLAPGASEDEVKAAYRALAQQYAPESKPEGPERREAEARMAELNDAFDTLISVLRTGVNTPVSYTHLFALSACMEEMRVSMVVRMFSSFCSLSTAEFFMRVSTS